MRIALTGASGLIGSALRSALTADGHMVLPLVRHEPGPGEGAWNPETGELRGEFDGLDAVVHLAGENIASGRWTRARKERIRRSRVEGTRGLARSLAALAAPPRALVCASAIGWYGDRGEEVLTEESPPGRGFLAGVCRDWEAAAEPAREAGLRVVHLRIGVVLAREGGALARMLPPFRLGLGGRIGNGRQWWSWITREELVSVIRHALEDQGLEGPVNAVALESVRNAEFTRVLARVLRRPAVLPVPAFALRLALGEMAGELLLASTRVDPARLRDRGYRWREPGLEEALRRILQRRV